MALIIADRVKESTTTTGSGRITLSGATFGGFQTFAEAIGDGNKTYYCIQNFDRFEIGLGTFRSSDNTLSRDTIFQSSNNDNEINITGASVVFSVVPADKLVYNDEDDAVIFPTPFVFKRSDSGDYWQAFSTDYTNRVASFYVEEGSDPTWKIGLKTTSSELIAPYYAYVSGKDGFIELRGNSSSILSMGDGNSEGLQVNHQLKNIIDIRKNGGEIAIQNLDLNSDETTTAKNTSIAYTVFAVESSASHAADLQTWNVATSEKASINKDGDFETVGSIISPSGRFTAVRFSDGTIQTTAGLPFGSGALIDQNTQNIITNSGYFQTYIDSLDHSATAVSGWARGYIDQTSGNLQLEISQVSSDLSSTSGYFESRVDSADSEILANSGYFESKISDSNSSLTTTSGYFESRVDSADSEILANSGYFESRANNTDDNLNTVSGLLTPSGESFDFTSNILTYNNSSGGSFTADLSSLSTFDTSGVGLSYSAGTLTYTNNAGGSFDVDLSSISGDVYALIVDGAPATLDTLNEIAAALNDDANVATTLTNLISTTSGNLQSQITSNDSDIATVSGIASKTFTVTASSSTNYTFDGMGLSSAADPTIYLHKGHTYYFDKQTSSHPFRISASDGGSVYQDADGNNIEINGQGILTFEVPQNAPDKLYYYCTAHPSSMKGIIYTTVDGSLSGYFESRVDINTSDIVTVSGLLYDDAAISGYFESRVDSADSSITANSGYFESRVDSADSSITANSGYFESRVNQSNSDIATVSGLLYDDAAISGYFESRVDSADVDILTVSGLLDSVNPTGTPSGVAFFDNTGSLSGNDGFTYDGNNLKLFGNVDVSGVSRFNAGVKTKLNTEADGATITFDMNESSSHTVELGGNRTLDVSNVDAGQKFSLRLKQDATGSHTVNWWNNISWMSVDGSEPTLRTSGVDYFGFVCTSGGYYEGFHLTEASTGGGGGSASITVKEADGTPNVSSVSTIVVSNGTLTNDGGGQVTISTGGGGGSYDDTYVSGVSTFASGLAIQNQTDIATVSGLIGAEGSGLPYASGDYYLQEIRANSASGLLNLNNINTVSGLLSPRTFEITGGDGSNYTIDGMGLNSASDPTLYLHKGHTYIFNKTFSGHPFRISDTDGGSVYQDADSNNIEIGSSAGAVTFEVPQDAPDKLYYYCTAHPSTMKGLIYTTSDGSLSGYFESRVDSADSDIATVSGLLYDDAAVSGYFESRVDQADADIVTVSGLLYDDTAISGYFESRVDSADSAIAANSGYFESRVNTNAADIITVSGLTGGGSSLTVQDVDGSPSVSNVTTIRVTNGSLTDNGGGTVTIATSGGGGGGGTTYTAGSGLSLVGTEFNVYGGSGNFEYLEIQTDNTVIPEIKFKGSGVTDTPISLEVASSFESATGSGSALLFQGKQGQLFSITDNLSSGTIFSVSDITGLPMLEIDASGHVQIGEFADDITIHKPILLSGGIPTSTTNKLYNNAGTLYFNGSALGAGGGGGLPYSSGDYYLQEIRSNSASGVSISGVLQPQITQNASDIATVSGLLYDDAAISGYFESRVDAADIEIAAVSGYAEDYTDSNLLQATGVSGIEVTSIGNTAYFSAAPVYTDLSYISGIAVYASGLDNYLLNPSGTDGIAITSTPESVIFSGDATLARVTDINAVSGVATSQTLQSITDNGSTTSNAVTINNDLTAEFIFAELDGPIVFECKNSTGAQIDAGTPVYISGYFGANGKALIAPARSDDSTKMPAIGVLEEDLIHDAEGHVNSFGRVQQIDTSSFTVGNTVYVAPSGGLTNVRPTGIGELVQNMGKVLRSDASQGRILLLGPGRTNDVPNSGEFKELTVDGHFSAVTKSFLIDHPSKEGAKLQYASLEGPENGVYVRGTTKETFITLPDYWRDLVHNSSVTVTLTPVGSFQPLFVESKSSREIIVGGVCGYYDYVVWGERKDVAKLEVEW
jgi:plastocyanin